MSNMLPATTKINSKRKANDIPNAKAAKLKYDNKVSISNSLKTGVNTINDAWSSEKSLSTDYNLHFSNGPFKHCIAEDFIEETEFLKELKEELLELDFIMKRNDLYQFHQSCDLSAVNKPCINSFKRFLVDECCEWIENATNIKLRNKVSVTCSSYNYSDHLLCHDDKCEDRRIAFILYLSDNWSPNYGGDLQLFNTDENGQPKEVVKTIWPKFNTLVFFEVMCKSFHQVAEVMVIDKTRLSVNGWFHGPLPECRDLIQNPQTDMKLYPPEKIEEDTLSYVNPMYLDSSVQEQISSSFEQDSEILLPDFFDDNFYKEICDCLCSDDISWEIQGPANRRKYQTPCMKVLPAPLCKVLQIFKSEQFYSLLGDLTKLDLSPVQEHVEGATTSALQPKCSYEIQQWQKTFYTLICDDHMKNEYALDVILYYNCHNKKQLQGGFVSYIARDADEELLTLAPSHNALALAFRDKETLRFVKYVNNIFEGRFHMLQFTYYEPTSSQDEETSSDRSP
ncbi:prolyl 3-hydroxylase OGFOD1 [Periplaneta americana]|uniref:prolyl 3-hydroxylase OGFOD1 n=1 Tax=Periplaneta americana TaxID=6978 RepID=UPI0037E7E610